MKKYTFIVISKDTYRTRVTVEAKNQEEAEEKVQEDLDACPIDTRSNTFINNDLDVKLSRVIKA